ncbi:MAG: 23S rRNA (guanosine(2251)-2'-O)-methyltransferase RlmB [Desulfobacterales bacterium]
MKTEILYGFHPVFEALKAGRREFSELYIINEKDSKRFEKISGLVKERKIPIKRIDSQQLQRITGSNLHQGIGAKVGEYPFTTFEDIFNDIKPGNSDFLLLLDNVVDPHNLGALVRTALCVGVLGIIITKDRSASPTPAVSKTSAGALEHVKLCKVTNMVGVIKEIKEKGFWVLGMDAGAEMPVFSCKLGDQLAIVIGGEGKGIRQLVKTNCDFLVSIPQKGSVSSLNASVAGAVVMYEAFRQRSYCGTM